MHIRELSSADATCGGKARNLGLLIGAGLPVPDGFVVLPAATPDEVAVALEAAAFDGLDGVTLAVRSSSPLEDAVTGAGPGVFESVVDVATADVWSAIERVRASAQSDAARRYAQKPSPTYLLHDMRRNHVGLDFAVIVQRFIPGTRITIYTRPPEDAAGTAAWIQPADGEPLALLREPIGGIEQDPRVELALAAERAIAATGGADVELVDDGTQLWVVQARPIVRVEPQRAHAVARMRPPAIVLAPLVADGRRWRWDVTHNPDPLSPAQTGLVELVERAGVAPWSMRVVGGYLYSAARDTTTAPPSLATDVADIEARMAAVLGAGGDVMSLADALERYVAFYRIWANELAPLVAAEQREDAGPGGRPSSVEATLFAAARGEMSEDEALARLGVLAPAWDVAVPTFAETPAVVRDAIARARLVVTPVASSPAARSAAAPIADLAERDDFWFAQAQWLVRRALRETVSAMGIEIEDAAWLPLDELAGGHVLDPTHARRRAAAARAASTRAAAWEMPIEVPEVEAKAREALRGYGTGGTVTGRVVRFASLAGAIAVGPRDVIVTRAVTPALAVLVVGCGALVSETGGPLDHGAALARELGIPCVVGCEGAFSALTDGMFVTVDGATGAVYSSSSS